MRRPARAAAATGGAAALAAAGGGAGAARAAEGGPPGGAQVDLLVDTFKGVLDGAGVAVKSALEAGSQAAGFVEEQTGPARGVVEDALKEAAPSLEEAGDTLQEAGAAAAAAASEQAAGLLRDQGVDLAPAGDALGAARDALDAAAGAVLPPLQGAAAFVQGQDPQALLQLGIALAAAYYVVPPVLGKFGEFARGYKGGISPTEALAAVNSSGAVLIDVRPGEEKERGGLPEIKKRRAYVPVEPPATPRDLRGKLRAPRRTEARVTAVLVGALKGVSRGQQVILMDSGNGSAKEVAKALAEQDFGNVYVMDSGFRGWKGALLATQAAPTSKFSVQVLPPASEVGTGFFGGSQKTIAPSKATRSVRALPAGRASTGSGRR